MVQNAQALALLLADENLQGKLAENAAETSKGLTWEERAGKFMAWVRGKW